MQSSCIENKQELEGCSNTSSGVHGQTLVLTDQGYYSMKKLHTKGASFMFWNGQEFIKSEIHQKYKLPMYRVSLSNGLSLNCSENHVWNVIENNKPVVVSTINLKPNIHIVKNPNYPIIEGVLNDSFYDEALNFFKGGKIPFSCQTIQTKIDWYLGLVNLSQTLYNKSIYSNLNYLFQWVQIVISSIGLRSYVYYDNTDINLPNLCINADDYKKLYSKGYILPGVGSDIKCLKECLNVHIISVVKNIGTSPVYYVSNPDIKGVVYDGILT